MTKPARATMNGGNNIIDGKSECFADFCIENLRYGLDFKIVVAGTKRSHFPSLSFLGGFRDLIRGGPPHLPRFPRSVRGRGFRPNLAPRPNPRLPPASRSCRLHRA